MRILNILVAEDDEQNHELIRLILERQGHCVHSVWNGIEAINAAKTGKFDLVFMDIQMPEMDGLEATRQIRGWEKNKRHIPIVILTASLLEKHTEEYKKAGADTFIQKPFNVGRINVLINMIASETESVLSVETHRERDRHQAELPILDVPDALPRFNNEMVFYLEHLQEFFGSLPTRLEKMNQSLKLRSWSDLSFQAHNLKGVSANFGAKQLSNLAARLEVACKQEKVRLAGQTIREITSNMDKVIEFANQIIEQERAQNSEL